VNANGKLLDVWMLICCELCGRTSKIPVHERIHVQALDSERLLMFENNDPAMVRDLAMDGALAGQAAYHLDWSGMWELETDMLSGELEREDPAPLKVIIGFELPAPIRVEKLLAAGFGLSRSAVLLYQGPGGHLWAYQVTSGQTRASSTPCCRYTVMAAAPSRSG
jgi:hypothetical protein